VLGGLVIALLAASILTASVNHIFALHDIPAVVLITTTTAVGVVVARHLPANPMGWLVLGIGVSEILSVEGTMWLTLDYGRHHGRLPLGWLALLLQPGWGPAFVLFGLTILLFPDGRLPSSHWRWLLWTCLGAAVVYLGGTWEISIAAIAGHHISVDSSGELASLDNPGAATAWWAAVQNVFFLMLAVSLLASVGRQLAGFVKSSGERRQQVKWALAGTAVSVTCGFVALSLSDNSNAIVSAIGNAAISRCARASHRDRRGDPEVPAVRHRPGHQPDPGLRDRDRTAGRGVHGRGAPRHAGPGDQVAGGGGRGHAGRGGAVQPAANRVQRLVDRRFNRSRYDADQTVAAFAARLQDAVDLDGIRADLVSVVDRSLEPAHVSMWFPPDGATARRTPHRSRPL